MFSINNSQIVHILGLAHYPGVFPIGSIKGPSVAFHATYNYLSTEKISVVSVDKRSVVSTDEKSVVCQDIPILLTTQGGRRRQPPCVVHTIGMSCQTTDFLSLDTTDILSADTTDVLSANTTDFMSTDTTYVLSANKPDLFYPHIFLAKWKGPFW